MSASLDPVTLADELSAVRIIDQRRLPGALVMWELRSLDDVIGAIQSLAVRGAPAIGICGAAGLAVVMHHFVEAHGAAGFAEALRDNSRAISLARPTAVNLKWAVDRCLERAFETPGSAHELVQRIADEARAILEEDRAMGRAIAAHGLSLLADPVRVMTHCNAGALATGGVGTAIAPIYAAKDTGRQVTVFATETRPLLQGARLTSWELHRAGIDVTVIIDSAAATVMREGKVDAVLVGADRIAANGDTANKIGTYSLAVNAARHGIPFYVLAPQSTVDPSTPDGASIQVEQRSREELSRTSGGTVIADDIPVWNPAFDVTPADLISAIITDRGVFRAPYDFGKS